MSSAPSAIDLLVDWDLAVSTGVRLAPSGPPVTRREAADAVAEMRKGALVAQEHVRELTGLRTGGGQGEVAVIDRPSWIRANVDGFRLILGPLADRLTEKRGNLPSSLTAAGSKVTGVETGSLLAFLSTRVLGQYEVFGPTPPGRLLLVAPNIVAAEREMGVDPHDFRLWVSLHEETHRVQMTAVPWLRDHLLDQVRELLHETDLEVGELVRRISSAAGAVAEAVRGQGETSLLEVLQTPEQRVILERITAVMSLVEGHAEYVMDAVGPSVVPTVADIRARFQHRRAATGLVDRVVRRLLGLDAKLRQYRDGERFVRAVVERVGMDGFNTVWTSPETLPTPAELQQPQAWVERVLPGR
jgi:coenzyme F420 biosynthesis associated uncharacterized protein